MDQIIEVQSDTMDICNSGDEDIVNTNHEHTPNIVVKELEDKVRGAMTKMHEIIAKKEKEEESLNLLKKEVEIIKRDELESLKISKKILDNRLMKCLDEQTKNIIIARRSYHSINNQYWWSSIFILVIFFYNYIYRSSKT